MTVLLTTCAACQDGGSGFAGDYEMLSVDRQSGACTGQLTPGQVDDRDHYFHLDDVAADAGGTLVAYYECTAPGSCSDVYDLYRSFGQVDGDWLTTIASAVQPPCVLGFRVRALSMDDDGNLRIDEWLYQEQDDSLSSDQCLFAEARTRGESMPCVEQAVWMAAAN